MRGSPTPLPASVRAGAGLLLVLFTLQAVAAAVRDSVTIDEFVGLPVGLYTLETGDFQSQSMNPPFFRAFAALPLLLSQPPVAPVTPGDDGNDWARGYRFMARNADRYQSLFIPARCMVIVAGLLLATLVFRWSTLLYGPAAGLTALYLFCFSPSILAHTHFVALDISGALGWTLGTFAVWSLLDRPTLRQACWAGIALGLAPLLKLSAVVLPFVAVTLIALRALEERSTVAAKRWMVLAIVAALTALLTVDLGYGFHGVLRPLGDLDFHSSGLVSLRQALPWLPLPIPSSLLGSVDTLLVGDQATEPTYFLAGRWSENGWWFYHLVAFALKTPLPFLFAAILSFGLWTAGRSGGRRDYCLFLSTAAVFAANSLSNPLNIGVRHALAALPMLAITASPIFARPLASVVAGDRKRWTLARAALSAAALVWLTAGTLAIAPRYLEYFNEIAGGPRNGHRWLIDSNLDWGQDLIRLSEYMEARQIDSIHLAYFGRVNPAVYGIRFEAPEEGRSHGPVAVSASLLMGRPYWVWLSPERFAWAKHGAYTWLQRYPISARVGSMFVVDVP